MSYNEKLGQKIVELFGLPKLRKQSKEYNKAYYYTTWGNKNLEGIGACVSRLTEEADELDFRCVICGFEHCEEEIYDHEEKFD
jgi:hypothetical protein